MTLGWRKPFLAWYLECPNRSVDYVDNQSLAAPSLVPWRLPKLVRISGDHRLLVTEWSALNELNAADVCALGYTYAKLPRVALLRVE